MGDYFDLGEFLYSDTAIKLGIQNYPDSFEIVDHLRELKDTILNPLREAWGSGILVTSGFRCKKLNDSIIGASKTSVHQIGYAVDLVPMNGEINDFIAFCRKWFKDKLFDQVIIEKSGKTRWIHVGLYNNAGEQRCLLFDMVL